MLKVGLTGGIATGKSYVIAVLGELGCEVSDADTLAHAAIAPGAPAHQDIINEFGPDVLNADGTINRALLGALVFGDAAKRERLNAIVHPRVYAAQAAWLAAVAARNPQAITVFDAALLIETGSYKRFDKIVVVWCEPHLQLERLMTRNLLAREQAEARIAAQLPTAEKLKYADFALNTSLGFEDTRRQTQALYRRLRALVENT